MQRDPRPDDTRADDELLHPSYWLVHGLQWQGDGDMAEAAVAIAPAMIARKSLGRDAFQILGCADLYARKLGARVIFFSDLTRMFTAAGTSWAELGVDWESALRDIADGPFPKLFLTISERAHIFICDPAEPLFMAGSGDVEEVTGTERVLVHQALAAKLAADWPPYMQENINSGRRVRGAG